MLLSLRILPVLPVLGLTALAACDSSTTLEPTYEACATDENWRTFDDYESTGRITSDATVTPVWTAPAMGTSIPAGAAPILSWQPSASVPGTADGDATCPQFTPASLGTTRGGLQIRHMPPVSGTVYDLHFAVGGQDAYRVLTTRQRTGVPANVWSGWSGKSVSVTLYEAKMLMNEVSAGPGKASALTLQVTP